MNNERLEKELYFQHLAKTNGILTPSEAADFLKVSSHTLSNWRQNKIGPNYIRINRSTIRYRIRDINSFLDKKLTQ